MSLKSKVLAGAASLTLVGGVGVAGALTAGTASAATPSCGYSCINIYSPDFGTQAAPSAVLDTYKQGENLGQPIILFRTSNVDPAEDYYPTYQGDVASLYAAGLITAAVALHYGCIPDDVGSGGSATSPLEITGDGVSIAAGGNFASCAFGYTYNKITTPADPTATPPPTAIYTYYITSDLSAVELEYSPFGVESGWCVGTATAAVNNTHVSLQPCGVSSKTYWIADYFQGVYGKKTTPAVPLINASTTDFSQPSVLTYPGSSSPTDEPRPQLYTSALTGETNGTVTNVGSVDDNQLWWASFGPLNN